MQPVAGGQATASMGVSEQQMPTKNAVAEQADPEKEKAESVPEPHFFFPESDSDESLPDIDSGNEASDLST